MNKSWQVVLAFIVVFLAGGAIGSVFTLRYLTPPPPSKATVVATGRSKPEEVGAPLMKRWLLNSNQLGITPAQREKIRAIIFDTAEDTQRVRVETTHSALLIYEHMQDEIAAVLTPAQRDKFYQRIQNQREQLNRFNREDQRRAILQAQAAGDPAE